MMDCTVIILSGGQSLRMVAYNWQMLVRALYQLGEYGFSKVLITTNSTFYTELTTFVASYTTAVSTPVPVNIQVILNPEHDNGQLPELANAMKYVNTRRCLLYPADIFQVSNTLGAFAQIVADDVDYLGAAQVSEPREIKRGGLLYTAGQEVHAIVEQPDPNASNDALRWNGVALFNRQLADDLDVFLPQAPTNVAIGDIFEYRRGLGKPVRTISVSDFIKVNSPDQLLLAGLYVAIEAHHGKPALCEELTKAISQLRHAI